MYYIYKLMPNRVLVNATDKQGCRLMFANKEVAHDRAAYESTIHPYLFEVSENGNLHNTKDNIPVQEEVTPDGWHNLAITDKTGKQYFRTIASPMSTMSELRNLKRHIEQAKQSPKHYKFLDIETAIILLDGEPYGDGKDIDPDAMLKELGL